MAILITGSRGFVGSHLVEYLRSRGHSLYSPSHRELDLTNYKEVDKYFGRTNDIDMVVHCATSGPKKWENRPCDEVWEKKIEDDKEMLENLITFSDSLIVLTSGSVDKYDIEPVARSKSELSKMCENRENILQLRPYGIYGPGEQRFRFPSYCFDSIYYNEPIYVLKNRWMSWIYVQDLCEIIEHFIEHWSKHPTIDVIMPRPITNVALAFKCLEVADSQVDVVEMGRGERYVGDDTALVKEMPWWVPTEWEEGLGELYDSLPMQSLRE